MNREIKFRAWDPARKSMENCISISPFGVDDCDRRQWEWNEIKVMQYTGVKDCNGRVIYEGDIAHHAVGWVGKVQYFEGSFEIEAKHQSWPINYVRGRKIEVIGNIYENPELLGGEVAEAQQTIEALRLAKDYEIELHAQSCIEYQQTRARLQEVLSWYGRIGNYEIGNFTIVENDSLDDWESFVQQDAGKRARAVLGIEINKGESEPDHVD